MSSQFYRRLFLFLPLGIGAWLAVRYLLPIAMPFILAALLALAAEPLVFFFDTRLKLPRVAAAGIGVSITLGLLSMVLMILGALLVRQLRTMTQVVPELENTAIGGIEALEGWLLTLAERTPEAIRPSVRNSVEEFFDDGGALVDRAGAWLLNLASGVVSRIPDSALGVGTWLLAGFMISAKLPTIRSWVGDRLPTSWEEKYLPMLRRMKKAVSGWLSAQLKLMGISFAVLTVGFLALQIPYAPVWAVLIALVDALPVLGSGMVLIPWSVVSFLQGEEFRAVGLLGIYAVGLLLRTVLEPKLVGKQLGLDPLVTLFAMYAGYRLWGVLGILLSPLLAVILIQLFTAPKENENLRPE